MLSALGASIISSIASTFLGKALDAFTAYVNKQITLAELEARVRQALVETFAEVEKAQADALARTYASFMAALQASKLMQVVWASVTLSQLAVLLWHQRLVSLGVEFGWSRYVVLGLVVAPVTVALATLALAATV